MPEVGEGAEDGRESRKESPADTAESDLSGQRVGRYKLLEKIGEGGFGIVYMAEQLEPVQRKVALKLIKPGMDSRAIIARFEAERQALALMDHPNIARFYDAGVADAGLSSPEAPAAHPPPPAALYGRPYFVMELVRGTALTDYCDQQQVPTRARLELFTQVCQAVQHAHQKGIIHRDLKPSNLLVTLHDGQPVPKIIDFGIAKALDQKLTDKTLFTGFAQLLGTPAYMSPEQAEMSGLDIDTRSDIYSLGVLLYQLLTSRIPFDPKELAAAGLDAIRQIIREKDPVRPSTKLSSLTAADQTTVAGQRQVAAPQLIRQVRGDLDWIVMRCLEKDRTRRYETANGLARDIERHLANEPVVACPPSRFYKFSKLLQRHKLIFAAAGTVTATLILGLSLSTFLFVREARARKLAALEGRKREQVARFLTDMLAGVGPSVALGQDTKLLRGILDKTAARVAKDLKAQPEVEAELLSTLGDVYNALAEFPTAEAMHRQALAIRTNLWGDTHPQVAESYDRLSAMLWGRKLLPAAEAAERMALTIRTQLFARTSAEVASSLSNLGVLLGEQDKLVEAELRLQEALALERKIFPGDDDRLAETLTALSTLMWKKKNLADAEKLDREALAMYQRLRAADDPEIAKVLNNLGTVLRDSGKPTDAVDALTQALVINRKVLAPQHPDTANAIYNLAGALWQARQLSAAERLYQEWLALPDRDPFEAAKTLNNLGTVLRNQGRLADAIATHRQACARVEKIPGQETERAVFLHNLASALWANGELPEAESAYLTLITNWTTLVGPESQQVAMEFNNLGTVLRDASRLAEAETAHQQGLQIQRKIKDTAGEANSLNNLATVRLGQRRPSEAEAMFQDSIRLFKETGGPENPSLVKPLRALAVMHQNAGKLDEATREARECLVLAEKHFADDWLRFDAESVLGGILAAKENEVQAEPLLKSGVTGLEQRAARIPADNKSRLNQACERLIQFYEKRGQAGPAADWKSRLDQLGRAQTNSPP